MPARRQSYIQKQNQLHILKMIIKKGFLHGNRMPKHSQMNDLDLEYLWNISFMILLQYCFIILCSQIFIPGFYHLFSLCKSQSTTPISYESYNL